jgi:putative ABC transport system permease protein
MLGSIGRDVRHAARVFVKNPGFTAIAVISIAFGTGANVAMFSVTDALLLRPLPVPAPEDLVSVGFRTTRGFASTVAASHADYQDIRERARSFEGLVAFCSRRVGIRTDPTTPPRVRIATLVSSNFFQVLRVEPTLGRGFRADEDDVPGRDAVAVLSHGTWVQEYDSDASVLGRTIQIASIDFTIVGVAPESFTGMQPRYIRDAIYVPLAMWPRIMSTRTVDPLTTRDLRVLDVTGRLKPGVSLADARAELETINLDLAREYPATNTDQVLTAQTELTLRFLQAPLDAALLTILSMLSFAVLSVACANVAGLLASRGPVRAREIALRLAIGAGRARIIRQLITESLGIALAGGAGGLAIGYVGIGLFRQIEFPTDVIALPVMKLDERGLIFSLIVATTSAFVFGLGPALQLTRIDLVEALKTTDTSARRHRRLTGRSALVVVQVALSLVLLTMAAFAFQVFRTELERGPGFRTARIAKISLDPGQARYSEEESARFFERAVDNARRLPGAGIATVLSAMPLFGFELASIVPEGFHLPPGEKSVRPYGNSVDEHYFAALEIPILEGRAFTSADTSGSRPVAIVNETLARRYWPGESAIGKRIRRVEPREMWLEVVGVAKTTTYVYPGEEPHDAIYFPFRQDPRGSMLLLVQTAGDSSTCVTPLGNMVRSMDADVPQFDAQTIERFYGARASSIASVCTRMIDGMGFMGLTLTMVGLYGLVSYAVSRRTREIGVRIAIGATRRDITVMILREGLTPAIVGVAVGLVLSAGAVRVMPMLAPFAHRIDPRWFLVMVPALFLVSVVASLVPARRAARVDPTVALRCE